MEWRLGGFEVPLSVGEGAAWIPEQKHGQAQVAGESLVWSAGCSGQVVQGQDLKPSGYMSSPFSTVEGASQAGASWILAKDGDQWTPAPGRASAGGVMVDSRNGRWEIWAGSHRAQLLPCTYRVGSGAPGAGGRSGGGGNRSVRGRGHSCQDAVPASDSRASKLNSPVGGTEVTNKGPLGAMVYAYEDRGGERGSGVDNGWQRRHGTCSACLRACVLAGECMCVFLSSTTTLILDFCFLSLVAISAGRGLPMDPGSSPDGTPVTLRYQESRGR